MEWVVDLRGKVIGLDTAPLIYYGAPFFLTNDVRLPSSPRLQVLILNNLKSF